MPYLQHADAQQDRLRLLHPTSLWVNLVVTVEAFLGLTVSGLATIEPWQCCPTLTFRVASVRQTSLVHGRFQASLPVDEIGTGGCLMPLALLGVHSISPLHVLSLHGSKNQNPWLRLANGSLSLPETTTLKAEVINVSGHCDWILIDDEKLALPIQSFLGLNLRK